MLDRIGGRRSVLMARVRFSLWQWQKRAAEGQIEGLTGSFADPKGMRVFRARNLSSY